jgi:DNA-binding NarL/FixJ family response regulator
VEHRVLLVMQRLPREIFKQLLHGEDGLELVGELDSAHDLAAAVRETEADLVIVDGDEEAPSVAAFVRGYSRLKVLAVEAAGDTLSLYEFSPYRSYVGEFTRETMLRTIEDGRP